MARMPVVPEDWLIDDRDGGLRPLPLWNGGPPEMMDRLLGDNRRIGEGARRALEEAGRSFSKNVVNNPYYDPRLVTMP
jgi:hypothetical protein